MRLGPVRARFCEDDRREAATAHYAPVELSDPFCTYCGRPPMEAHPRRRVCDRCQLGMILRAPAGDAPRLRDAFLIVDDKLTVQAISQRAELLLGVEEPDGVFALLDDFLQPLDRRFDGVDVALLLTLAVTGSPPQHAFELVAVGDPRQRFLARVASCGKPPAALLVLAAATDRVNRAARTVARLGVAPSEELTPA
jgi:PAS domain-containing protein